MAAPRRPTAFWPLWAAAVAVPLLTLAGGAFWSWRLVQAEAHARIERTVGTLHEHALRAFETQDAILAAIQRLTRGMSWNEIAASGEVAGFLGDLDANTPGAGAIGLVAPGGRVAHISVAAFPPPHVDLSDRDYVRAQTDLATAGPFVGETVVARVGGPVVFPYSRPRIGPDERPDGGTLWVTFRIAELGAFYARVLERRGDTISLIRADGALLARHPLLPEGPIGRRLPPDSPELAALRKAMAAPPGQVVFLKGEGQLTAIRRVGDLPVAVAYALSDAGPKSAWLGHVAAMAAVALAAALLLLWVTLIAAERARREAAALTLARDEAERRAEAEAVRGRAETLLRGAQRLETLGQVTAGVAHDFRNVIQAVQGGALLARRALAVGDAARAISVLDLTAEAAGRGADLTDRMLRVARGHGLNAEDAGAAFDPAAAARSCADLLRRTLAAGYPVDLRIGEGAEAPPAQVRGSLAELESALLNLAVNARDAMPAGGRLSLSVTGVDAGASGGAPQQARLRPGRYARFAISDEGDGMDAATLARAGEAFFTTKGGSRGTGLGLSSVRAFAESAGGALTLESAGQGAGTTVTLWLPEWGHAAARPLDGPQEGASGG